MLVFRKLTHSKAVAFLLTLALVTGLLQVPIASAIAEAAPTDGVLVAQQISIQESDVGDPRIVEDSNISTGYKTTWDCVWFGNYLQSDTNGDGLCLSEDTTFTRILVKALDEDGRFTSEEREKYRFASHYADQDGYFYVRAKDGKMMMSAKMVFGLSAAFDKGATSQTFEADAPVPIKWRVLSCADSGEAVLLADQSLDILDTHVKSFMTWETSIARSFLNSYGSDSNAGGKDFSSSGFLTNAFDSDERAAIYNFSISNEDNPVWGTSGGNDTADRVFLLSLTEAMNRDYGFISNEFTHPTYDPDSISAIGKKPYWTDADPSRVAAYTDYVECNMEDVFDQSGLPGKWWLRSPGYYSNLPSEVGSGGSVSAGGLSVGSSEYALRPALRINLRTSSALWSFAGTVSSDGSVDEVAPSNNREGIKLLPGETKNLSIKTFSAYIARIFTGKNYTFEWKTSDESVVSVINKGQYGTVSARNLGTATITATCKEANVRESWIVTVTDDIPMTGMYITNRSDRDMTLGDKTWLSVSFEPYNTSDNRAVTWTSSDNQVVTVSQNGCVKAVGIGSAAVTATCGAFSSRCYIDVGYPQPHDFDWDWSWFSQDPTQYNHQLAIAAGNLCLTYENLTTVEVLKQMGFQEDDILSGQIVDGTDLFAFNPHFTFATKKVLIGGVKKDFLLVIVRGSGSLGDFMTDAISVKDLFVTTRNLVMLKLDKFCESHGLLKSDVVMMATGHSLGGAVVGQLAQISDYYAGKNNSYFYTFESPNYGSDNFNNYDYVHNIVNLPDLVPWLPKFGGKVGQTWYYDSRKDEFKQAVKNAATYYPEHDIKSILAMMDIDRPAKDYWKDFFYSIGGLSVFCPVDIEVYDADGELVGWTEGETSYTPSSLEVIIETDGDKKYVYYQPGRSYSIKFKGTDSGAMTCHEQLIDAESGEVMREKVYSNVALEDGKLFRSQVSSYIVDDSALFVVDDQSDPKCIVGLDGVERDVDSASLGGMGGGLVWTMDGAIMTVSGLGPMRDYDYSDAKAKQLARGANKIVIEDGATSIGSFAFAGGRDVTEVHIPTSVACISDCAFSGCDSLTDIWYGGTKDEWRLIAMNSETSAQLSCLNVHFTVQDDSADGESPSDGASDGSPDGVGAGAESDKSTSSDGASATSPSPISIADSTVTVNGGPFVYDGTPFKPSVTVRLKNGTVLTQGEHYRLTYANNTNAGSAWAKVKGIGGYTGEAAGTFKIGKAASAISLVRQSKAYKGKALSYTGKVRKSGSAGKVTYKYYSDAKCKKQATPKVAGTYYVKATLAADANHKSAVSSPVKFVVAKAKNTLSVKVSPKKVKVTKVKKRSFKVAPITVKKAKGAKTFKVTKWITKKAKKCLAVSKSTGKVTVKKGAHPGTYRFKVKVSAKGNTNYKAASKSVAVTVKVLR